MQRVIYVKESKEVVANGEFLENYGWDFSTALNGEEYVTGHSTAECPYEACELAVYKGGYYKFEKEILV